VKKRMRVYRTEPLICPTCGKAMHSSEPIEFRDGQYQHAINCVAPPPLEAYRARVAAKRAARRTEG
jgi:hypothetical protein